ncbi:hypothetical protein U1Q18_017518 [Sarracenia purpurea var. burkii]
MDESIYNIEAVKTLSLLLWVCQGLLLFGLRWFTVDYELGPVPIAHIREVILLLTLEWRCHESSSPASNPGIAFANLLAQLDCEFTIDYKLVPICLPVLCNGCAKALAISPANGLACEALAWNLCLEFIVNGNPLCLKFAVLELAMLGIVDCEPWYFGL